MPGIARKIAVTVHFRAVQVNSRRVVAEQLESQPVDQLDSVHVESLPEIDRGAFAVGVGAVAHFRRLVAVAVAQQARPGLPVAVVKAWLGPVAAGRSRSVVIAPLAADRHDRPLQRRSGVGQSIEETIGTGVCLVRRVVERAIVPKSQSAVLRLGQELSVGCQRHTGVVGQHALLTLGQTQRTARLDSKLIRPGHHQALGQSRCLLCVHRPAGAEFVFRVQPIVQDRPGGQAVNPVSELVVGIGRHLTGVIPLGGVRAAVAFTPDEIHLRGGRHPGQVARERDRLRRPLGRRLADDLRQARFAAGCGDDLGDDQHVGAGQAAIEPVDGEDVFTGVQPVPVRGDVERLETHRQ